MCRAQLAIFHLVIYLSQTPVCQGSKAKSKCLQQEALQANSHSELAEIKLCKIRSLLRYTSVCEQEGRLSQKDCLEETLACLLPRFS